MSQVRTAPANPMPEVRVLPTAEEAVWQAVVERDKSWDGRIFFAVRTTGVYCRPSCPARRPRRENVEFFASPQAAERAGFRACRRCRPRELNPPDPQAAFVAAACEFIDAHPEEQVTLDRLGEAVGVSPHHLQRIFKRVVGVSPRDYAEARRLGRLKQDLKGTNGVTGAIYSAGYGSSSRLYEVANDSLGMTPATYRRGGAGAAITYAIADSPLGRLLVGMTERGICSVSLGDSDDILEDRLVREFPAASLSRDDGAHQTWVQAIVDSVSGQPARLDLPLDVQATAFQRRVWSALRAIPAGETRSYSEIARELGQPTAARAVAQACATNPVALVIPCHRVVRSDGALGGYRWGVTRKQHLLEGERGAAGPGRESA